MQSYALQVAMLRCRGKFNVTGLLWQRKSQPSFGSRLAAVFLLDDNWWMVFSGNLLPAWAGIGTRRIMHLIKVVVALEAVPIDVNLLAELSSDSNGSEARGPLRHCFMR